MKKIVLTGPESSGKTTMTNQLADHFRGALVPEMARTYLNAHEGPYQEEDLLQIARLQRSKELEMGQASSLFLFCDTDLRNIRIWSLVKYGRVHPWIEEQIAQQGDVIYLLCHPDLPWEPDPLREHPQARNELFEHHKTDLETAQKDHFHIDGIGPQRLEKAIQIINQL